jgi:hypothetical protein
MLMAKILVVLLLISASAMAGNIDSCLTDPPCSAQDQAARDARAQAAAQAMRDQQNTMQEKLKNFTFPSRARLSR